jgi:hypothetical protein
LTQVGFSNVSQLQTQILVPDKPNCLVANREVWIGNDSQADRENGSIKFMFCVGEPKDNLPLSGS